MKKTSQIISAAMTLALGILFVILKADVVGICLTVLGVALIVVGWLLLDVALLILGIVLLIYGILELIKRIMSVKGERLWAFILGLISPVICVVASVFLITSRGSAITWTVIVAGVFLIVNGVLALISALGSKN
jgi:uncharacterized membrane protein HdeD (DUF308 family)